MYLMSCVEAFVDLIASVTDTKEGMFVKHRHRWLAWALPVLLVPLKGFATPFPVDPSTAIGRIVSEMKENEWARLNTTTFDSVWTPESLIPSRPDTFFKGSPRSVIQAWSSMAWDSTRGDLVFFGGGHANYTGNDVYRWRGSTLEWERASLPSAIELISGATYRSVDGENSAPIGAHTYDNSEFLPNADRFVSFGGAAFNDGKPWSIQHADGTSERTGPYFWDPSRADAGKVGGVDGSGVDPTTLGGGMWENRGNLIPTGGGAHPGDFFAGFVNGTTALSYDPSLTADVLYVADIGDLWRYTVTDVNDPAADVYERLGRTWDPISGQGAGAFDYLDNIFLRTANGVFSFWDLDLDPNGIVRNQLFLPVDASGTFDFSRLTDYGMDYDPIRDRFLLWLGDGLVWELSVPANPQLDDWVVQEIVPEGLLMPDSTALVSGTKGILGKWKYIPGLDIFLGVEDSTRGDIWAYKPTGWDPDIRPRALPGVDVLAPVWLMLPLFGWLISCAGRRMVC